MNFWLVQAIGAVALVFVFLSWNAKERKNIIALQSINLAFFIVHYLLLSAFVGAAMCVIVLGRNIVLLKKDTKRWASHPAWFYVFSLTAVSVLAFSWNGWISVLPVIGVITGMYGMWHDRPSDMRFYMLIASVIWIPYTIAVYSYSGLLSQIVGTMAILIGMYRHDRKGILTP